MLQLRELLSKKLLAVIASILVFVVVSAGAYLTWSRGKEVHQPIAFNHRAHVENAGIECSECHTYYSTGPRSGLPDAETCMACHTDPVSESTEETKLREAVQRGEPVVFRKLFSLPPDVFYSHRLHAVVGKIECARCHGAVAETQTPPTRPLVEITMDFCINCHTEVKANNDCKSCHR